MPLIMNLDDERLEERSKESGSDIGHRSPGATSPPPRRRRSTPLVAMGRCADLLVLGRPRRRPENVALATVEAATVRCPDGRAIASAAATGPSDRSSWRGTVASRRRGAVEYALPLLARAAEITLLVVGSKPDDVGAPYLARNLASIGLKTSI